MIAHSEEVGADRMHAPPAVTDLTESEVHQIAVLNRLDRPLLDALVGLVTVAADLPAAMLILERISNEAPDACLDLAELGARRRTSIAGDFNLHTDTSKLPRSAGDPRALVNAVLKSLSSNHPDLDTRAQLVVVAMSLGRWLTAAGSTEKRSTDES